MNFNKKIIYAGVSALVIGFSLILGGGHEVLAATVGDQLNSPEIGWSRHEDSNSNITYTNGNWVTSSASIFTNSHCTWTISKYAVCRFNFIGSKIRIISDNIYHDTNNVKVKIDGQDAGSFSEYRDYEIGHIICYESTNLSPGEHSIEMTTTDTRGYSEFVIDAIDLEQYGQIIPYHQINANAIIRIEPHKFTNKIGEQFTTDITMGNIENINSEDIIIRYDPNKLKYNGITGADGIAVLKAKNSNGTIRVCCKNSDISSNRKVLFGIKFTPIAAGNATIKIDNCKVTNKAQHSIRALRPEECNEDIIVIS